jgi:cysteine synthase
MPVFPDIVSTVGRTPLIKLNRIAAGRHATVALKAEFFNPWAASRTASVTR